MKTRPKPGQTRMAKAAALAARDNRIARAIDARVNWLKGGRKAPEPRLWEFEESHEFTDEEEYAILALSQKEADEGTFDYEQFVKKLDQTTPVLARPRMTNKPLDLWRMLSQPEILERLWPHWKSRTGSRGRNPGYFAKALLVCTAALGFSAHLDDNYEKLTGEDRDAMLPLAPDAPPTRLQVVFDWIEQLAAAAAGIPAQTFKMKSYEKVLAQIARIVDPVVNDGALSTDHCVSSNIEMLKWLSITYPTTCVRLGIDGMLIKAWVKQIGKQVDPEKEKDARGPHAPHASSRFIKGKRGRLGRFVRGYYLYVLTDLATNLPDTWGLWPAGDTKYDVQALRYLLNNLFEEWRECPTTHIVADKAWDEKKAIRDCAARFGIHLIVGRDDEKADAEEQADEAGDERLEDDHKKNRRSHFDLDPVDHPHIARFDRYGNAYCRYDGLIMKRTSFDFLSPTRRSAAGLTPGEAAHDGSTNFRVFYECPNPKCRGPKKRSLPMHLDWAALSAYPHNLDGHGRPDLHAERLALYARRNSCEALFGALKPGHSLGLDGSDRTHTPNERTVETLLSLALVLRTAFVTAHERAAQGGPDRPPAELLAALAAAR